MIYNVEIFNKKTVKEDVTKVTIETKEENKKKVFFEKVLKPLAKTKSSADIIRLDDSDDTEVVTNTVATFKEGDDDVMVLEVMEMFPFTVKVYSLKTNDFFKEGTFVIECTGDDYNIKEEEK